MKYHIFAGCLATTLAASITVQGAQMSIPTTVVNGSDVFSGPSFTVSGNFGLSDFVYVEGVGTVDLAAGQFTANAAGVITARRRPIPAGTSGKPARRLPALPCPACLTPRC